MKKVKLILTYKDESDGISYNNPAIVDQQDIEIEDVLLEKMKANPDLLIETWIKRNNLSSYYGYNYKIQIIEPIEYLESDLISDFENHVEKREQQRKKQLEVFEKKQEKARKALEKRKEKEGKLKEEQEKKLLEDLKKKYESDNK